jgi:glycine/serine hydroxymethyltransferase
MRENHFSIHSNIFIGGLVAAGYGPNPFEFSDVVMTTTHKT